MSCAISSMYEPFLQDKCCLRLRIYCLHSLLTTAWWTPVCQCIAKAGYQKSVILPTPPKHDQENGKTLSLLLPPEPADNDACKSGLQVQPGSKHPECISFWYAATLTHDALFIYTQCGSKSGRQMPTARSACMCRRRPGVIIPYAAPTSDPMRSISHCNACTCRNA
jgi:hypothetical protein